MAKLGADFNASKPVEADFVRHPTKPNLATEIRHIRSRLKDFWGELFCLDSDVPTFGMKGGDFKDDVIPSTAFVEHPDKPDSNGQFYTSVTVDRRGFVIKGSFDLQLSTVRYFRAIFTSDGAQIETESGISKTARPPLSDWPSKILFPDYDVLTRRIAEYRFIVPAKVKQIKVLTVGGGFNSTETAAGKNAAGNWTSFSVTPGEEYRILVGQEQTISGFCTMDYERYTTSSGVNRNVISTTSGNLDKTRLVDFIRPPYRPYGLGGAVGQLGNPGMVLLEWYA